MSNEHKQKENGNMNSAPLDLTTQNEQVRDRAKDPTFWREQLHAVRLIWRLLRDPEVPIYLKVIPLAAVVYLFVPIDLLPDALLGLGQLDDLTILLLGSKAFTNLVPDHLIERHRQDILREDGFYLDDDDKLNEAIVIDNDQ